MTKEIEFLDEYLVENTGYRCSGILIVDEGEGLAETEFSFDLRTGVLTLKSFPGVIISNRSQLLADLGARMFDRREDIRTVESKTPCQKPRKVWN